MLLFSGTFYDFNCVPGGRSSTAPDGYQYISPNLTFPCDGVVTKWKIGVEDRNDPQVHLQIWRPVGTDYSHVAETVYTNSGGQTITEVPTDMNVLEGDVIGFYVPRNTKDNNVGLRLAWAPVPNHVLLQGVRSDVGVSPVATFTGSPTTLSSSPLVSVMFGKCTMIGWGFIYILTFAPHRHDAVYTHRHVLDIRIIPGQTLKTDITLL